MVLLLLLLKGGKGEKKKKAFPFYFKPKSKYPTKGWQKVFVLYSLNISIWEIVRVGGVMVEEQKNKTMKIQTDDD